MVEVGYPACHTAGHITQPAPTVTAVDGCSGCPQIPVPIVPERLCFCISCEDIRIGRERFGGGGVLEASGRGTTVLASEVVDIEDR